MWPESTVCVSIGVHDAGYTWALATQRLRPRTKPKGQGQGQGLSMSVAIEAATKVDLLMIGAGGKLKCGSCLASRVAVVVP